MTTQSLTRSGPRRAGRGAWLVLGTSLAAAAAGATACSACDGVIGCHEAPRLGLSGEFVSRDVPSAPAVPGVRVDVVSRSPDVLLDSAASATTDDRGWWAVAMRARTVGTATVDVVVTPPAPDPAYRVTGLQFATSATRGAGAEAGRWVPRLFISYVGKLVDKATGTPIFGAHVTIVRRGGVAIAPTIVTDTAPKTDSTGTFLYDVKPAALAPLSLQFLIDRPGLPRATVNTTILPGYTWGPAYATPNSTFVVDSAGQVTGPGVAGPGVAAERARAPR